MRGLLARTAAAAAVLVATAAVLPSAPSAAAPASSRSTRSTGVTPAAGWYLALVGKGPTDRYGTVLEHRQSLELVSPTGATTTVYSSKVTVSTAMFLIDWSVDGTTALLGIPHRHGLLLLRVDVGTGAATELKAKNVATAILDPDGSGVVAELFDLNDAQGRFDLAHITWAGAVTTYPVLTTGNLMAGPGGTVLTGPSRLHSQKLQRVALGTGAVTTIAADRGCRPVRDWDATHALLSCFTGLSLLDWSTGTTTSLATAGRNSGVGYIDARTLPSGRYLNTVGEGCDVASVAREAANGSVHQVRVPTARGSNLILLGTAGKRLVVEHQPNPCSGGATGYGLTLLNPVTGKEKPLLVLGSNRDLSRDVLGFGEVHGQIG